MKHYLFVWFIFCLIGAGLELAYGAFWSLVGTTPWVYPNSPVHYTSLEGLPLWGLGAWVCISVYMAIQWRSSRALLGVIPPIILGVLWIAIYAWFIA